LRRATWRNLSIRMLSQNCLPTAVYLRTTCGKGQIRGATPRQRTTWTADDPVRQPRTYEHGAAAPRRRAPHVSLPTTACPTPIQRDGCKDHTHKSSRHLFAAQALPRASSEVRRKSLWRKPRRRRFRRRARRCALALAPPPPQPQTHLTPSRSSPAARCRPPSTSSPRREQPIPPAQALYCSR